MMEIIAEFKTGSAKAFGLKVRLSNDDKEAITIRHNRDTRAVKKHYHRPLLFFFAIAFGQKQQVAALNFLLDRLFIPIKKHLQV